MLLEPLEPRLAPAGIVTATLAGGVLTLTGDFESNALTITEPTADTLHIVGVAGTVIVFNGGAPATQIDIPGVSKGLTADLKQNSDNINLSGLSLTGNLTLKMAAGVNNLSVSDTTIGGNLLITSGLNNDSVALDGITVAGTTTLQLGDGANTTVINGPTPTLGKGLTYTGGNGEDHFSLSSDVPTTVGGALTINTGAGLSMLLLSAPALNITGGLSLTTGAHSLGEFAQTQVLAQDINIGGSVTIRHGDGPTITTFGIESQSLVNVGGNFSVTHSANSAASSTAITALSMTVGGSLSVVHGNDSTATTLAGAFSNAFVGTLSIGGSLTLSAGNVALGSFAQDKIDFGEVIIGGKLSISGRSGFYVHEILAAKLHAAGGISITHQASVDPGGSGVTTTSLDTGELVTSSLTLTNGAGAFANLLISNNAHVTGGVAITNGATGPLLTTTNDLQGNWDIGKDLSIVNAAGSYTSSLSGSAGTPGVIRIAKDLAITNGISNANGTYVIFSGGLIGIGGDATIRGGHGSSGVNLAPDTLAIGGDLKIYQGNSVPSATTVHQIAAVSSLTIGGGLLIRNGAGEFLHNIGGNVSTLTIGSGVEVSNGAHTAAAVGYNDLTLAGGRVTIGGPIALNNSGGPSSASFMVTGLLDLGAGITVVNGAGDDSFLLQAGSASIHGSLAIRGGAGSTTTQITTDPAGALALRGGITVSSLGLGGSLDITASGRIGGAITGAFGASGSLVLNLVGNSASGLPLLLAGPLVVSASAATSRALNLSHVSLLTALNLTGSSISDHIIIADSTFSGPATLNLLGDSDILQIDRSTFRGAFTLNAGAGNDSLMIGTDAGSPTATQFLGPVTVRLDAGDDSLTIEENNAPAYFHTKVLFDGGGDTDTLNATLTQTPAANQPRFLAGLPTVTNFE